MISIVDQIGHHIELHHTPKRIVSLVPSQTEYLHDLGLRAEVVGITKFCIHPEHWKKDKAIIGGTKNIHHDKIAQLKPDLIIANKEENTKEDILKLKEDYPVYTSNIFTIEESFKMMDDLGELLNKQHEASALIEKIQYSFQLGQRWP
jgi:iron complex transport system substrate-binding protein